MLALHLKASMVKSRYAQVLMNTISYRAHLCLQIAMTTLKCTLRKSRNSSYWKCRSAQESTIDRLNVYLRANSLQQIALKIKSRWSALTNTTLMISSSQKLLRSWAKPPLGRTSNRSQCSNNLSEMEIYQIDRTIRRSSYKLLTNMSSVGIRLQRNMI